MLHASITKFGVVRGTSRDLVEAAALILASPPSLEELLASLPEQLANDCAG
ncbi:MAG TPA: hypothetical protein VHD81_01630 [Mycobacteriales bacterium]|nr:hypothetical protein [Mycobacteriales bacterium]